MEMKYVPTTCPYCGTGCGFNLVVKDKKVVGVAPWHRNPVNEGKLCPKGNYAWRIYQQPGPADQTAHQEGREICRGELGRGLQADRVQVQVIQGRRDGMPCICPCLQRRELPDAEVCPGGLKDPQHRPLRPSLPCIDGRRACRCIRVRCNDPVDCRYCRIKVSPCHRQQHVRDSTR